MNPISFLHRVPRILPVLVLAAGMVTYGCGKGASDGASGRDSGGRSEPQGQAPIEVSAAVAVEREVPLTITATGSFLADEVSNVASETAGLIVETPVDLGDRVSRGTVLARLDARDAALRLDQARASARQADAALAQAQGRHGLAQSNAARYDALITTGDVPESLREQAATEAKTTEQAVATAEAVVSETRSRIALAEKAVADTVIRAPFAGFITERSVAVGEYVAPGTHIATVMKLDPIRLRLQVPERLSSRIALGQRVTARVEGLGGRVADGKITAISAALDVATRSTLVEAVVPNSGGVIRSAMFATAELALPETERALFIPSAALADDPNTNSVRAFVIEGDVARLRVLQLGPATGDTVRIASGIARGDRVAVSGVDRLFDGARVRLVERATPR